MGKKTIFLVQEKKAYFYKFEGQCMQAMTTKGYRIILRKICEVFKLPLPVFAINQEILNGKKIIFTDYAFHVGVYKRCLKIYGKQNLYLYCMNVIDNRIKRIIPFFEHENIYTFDFHDASIYNIKFKHTPFSSKVVKKGKTLKYDTVFLGRAKNRIGEIEEIYSLYKGKGINAKFMVLDSRNKEFLLERYLDYSEYLGIVCKSRTITEINISNQAGGSLRMVESLFFEKKLITSNHFVINDPYYDKKNVFVLGRDDINKLLNFVNDDFYKVKDISALDFENWIEEF